MTAAQTKDQPHIFNGAFEVHPVRAYSTRKNAERAVAKRGFEHLRHYFAWTQDGRCFPIFVGEHAMQFGVHFHFNVVG